MVTSGDILDLFYADDGVSPITHRPPAKVTLTLRVEADVAVYLDAMAAEAGVSRNVMGNHLLNHAIGSVLGQLPDVIRESIEHTATTDERK